MPSNSLPDADLSLPEMKTKSPSCPAGGVHMYAIVTCSNNEGHNGDVLKIKMIKIRTKCFNE